MKRKLALINGILGVFVGLFLMIGGPILLVATIGGIAASNGNPGGSILGAGLVTILFVIAKLAVLILGIAGFVVYSGDEKLGVAPNILLVVGSIVSIIPFLGFIGAILILIGGALLLIKS